MAARAADVDGEVAERQPELACIARERDRGNDGIGGIGGLLGKSNRVAVLNAEEAQVRRLLKGYVFVADTI
ncbi:hypothetical protein ACVWW5_002235 [Bradyrhizobium sp. LM3.4]